MRNEFCGSIFDYGSSAGAGSDGKDQLDHTLWTSSVWETEL